MDKHIPVMLFEVIEYLQVKKEQKYIDATVGAGGFTEAILKRGGEVLGIDQDPKSLAIAEERLKACPGTFSRNERTSNVLTLVRGNFSNLQEIAQVNGFAQVHGIVFDLGFASFQVEDAKRGLSFQRQGPLDMRLDPNLGVTAGDLVNLLSESQLCKLFIEYGDEPMSLAIAKAIVVKRKNLPIKTTSDLVLIINEVYKQKNMNAKINPATKVFQALRIAVNSELDNLATALLQSVNLLVSQGRLVVVSFHSGEDRIVKAFFKEQERQGILKILSPKPIIPSPGEIQNNPRTRSAKLRAIEKI